MKKVKLLLRVVVTTQYPQGMSSYIVDGTR